MDYFRVPTLTFNLLYCFYIISRDRRRILHFNITGLPPVVGSFSSYGKRSPISPLPDSSSLVTARSTDWKFLLPFDR